MELGFESSNSSSSNAIESGNMKSNRYEIQKRRDWITFSKYLINHQPPLTPSMCKGSHVLEFLHNLDNYGRTKVHNPNCSFFGTPKPARQCSCRCPLRQAWGSLDSMVGRLRAAYTKEISGGSTNPYNPFADDVVRTYLRDVFEIQSKARGVKYRKQRNVRNPTTTTPQ